jgi:hypothetical protein
MSRSRPYVGRSVDSGKLAVFRSDVEPTEETHGDRYKYAIGPFRTVRGAIYMTEHPQGPCTVAQCEKLAGSVKSRAESHRQGH